MKIGIDIHGVIDTYPFGFAKLSRNLIQHGHEVHIVTGESWATAEPTIKKCLVKYTHHFSIVDYHREKKTEGLYQDKDGNWWMGEKDWNASKGLYAQEVGLDIHFDDQDRYQSAFPKTCAFIIVEPVKYEMVLDVLNDMVIDGTLDSVCKYYP